MKSEMLISICVMKGSSAPKPAKMSLKIGITKTIRKMVIRPAALKTTIGYISAALTLALRASLASR